MTERIRGDTNVRQSRNRQLLHSKVFSCLIAAIVVGAIVTAEDARSSKYRRTDVDGEVLTSLILKEGVRSNVQCAALCQVPECSGFSLDITKQECHLFSGQLLGPAVEPDYTLYVKVPACPTEQGFHLVTVSSTPFCIGVFSTLVTMEQADAACRAKDSRLTRLDTQRDYDALALAAQQMYMYLQTSYLYVGMSFDWSKNQFVLDQTGEPPAEGPFWNYDQPDNPLSEGCVIFHIWDHRLHDGFCNIKDGYSCQKFV